MVYTPKRKIKEVLNLETGEPVNADMFFTKRLPSLIYYRSELQKAIMGIREPLFVCYYCKQLLGIRGGFSANGEKKKDLFHFAHLKDSDDCHIKTQSKLSVDEVNAIKYNGAKESFKHRYLKDELEKYLNINAATKNEVSNVQVEKIIFSTKVQRTWRRPDINFLFKNEPVALELQLSTTWLDVITQRQHFYKENKMHILWIFCFFDEDDDQRKLTYSDVVYTNNENAFVFDEEALQLSRENNDLYLKCFFKVYELKNLEINERWDCEYVTLGQLTFEENTYRIFYWNAARNKSDIERKIITAINTKNRIEALKAQLPKKENSISHCEIELSGEIEKLRRAGEIQDHASIYTSKVIKKIKDAFAILPFEEEDLYNSLKSKYANEIEDINTAQAGLWSELELIQDRLTQINKFDQINIGNNSYWLLDPRRDSELIRSNFASVFHIEKNYAHELFASNELKFVNTDSEFINLTHKGNSYFVKDFSEEQSTLKLEMHKLSLQIKEQDGRLRAITEKIQADIFSYFNKQEEEIKSQIKHIRSIINVLNISLQEIKDEIKALKDGPEGYLNSLL